MAEVQISQEIKDALQSFFQNSEIKVYEAGLEEDRPERIQDRPFFSVVPDSETIWLANNKLSKKSGSYNLSIGADKTKVSSLDTESHKFIQETEKRFRDIQPDAKLFIIDPDVIMGRYAVDVSRNRSLGKSVVEFLHEKLTENKITEHKAEAGDEEVFIPAAIAGNSPFSMPLPTGVSEDNLAGTGKICIVVASNPDKVMHELWTEVPGSKERMEALGIDFDATRRMVLYHELGHAMDIWSDKGSNPITSNNITDQTFRRHRTECLADTFATLQVARDFKSTETPELMGDLRACFAYDGYKKGLPEYRAKMKMFGILGEQWEKHKKTKELEEKLGIAEKPNKETKEVQKLEKNSKDFKALESIAMTLAYNVTPVTDAAIKIAQKGLKDGSLLKMTDKEVLELAEKIVEEKAFDKNRLNKAAFDILTGNKENEDIKAIEARYETALKSMPLSESEMAKRLEEDRKKADAARDKAIRTQLHLKVKENAPKANPEEAKELVKWIEGVFDAVEKKGGSTLAIVSVVAEEKDKLRTSDKDKLQPQKMVILNNVFVAQAPEIELSNKANQAVISSIVGLDIKVEGIENLSGGALLNAFVQNEVQNAQAGVNLIQEKQGLDFASMDIVQINKAQVKENQDFIALLTSEKVSQMLAMKIRSDKDAWKIASGSEKMGEIVTKKAIGKPADWLASYHLSLIEKNTARQEDVVSNILVSNQACVSAVKEINEKFAPKEKGESSKIISLEPTRNKNLAPKALLKSKIMQR